MTTSRKPQPTDRENIDPSRFTHLHDCVCPTCMDDFERPDFLAARQAAVARAEAHVAALAATFGPDDLHREATRTLGVMHDRLSRHQACEAAWDFPDHFTVTTRIEPGVRSASMDRFLVTLLDVRDSRGRIVATLGTKLHGGGKVAGGRPVTALDAQRLDPDDPRSPVEVGLLREWFDADHHTVATTE